ncbi:MAG: hypothetical protein JXB14_00545 [Candidatus Altiarchaeota archaeon]|nr:hypothetical protein [Candidatus Altiarchaeota archaeon]
MVKPVKKDMGRVAYLLGLTAGLLISIFGLLLLMFDGQMSVMGFTIPVADEVARLAGGVGIISGAMVFLGSELMLQPSKRPMGSTMVIVFAATAMLGGGGFGNIGTVLGVLSGIVGIFSSQQD